MSDIPSNFALIVLLLALIPGWVVHASTRRYVSWLPNSSLGDLLSTVTMGLALLLAGGIFHWLAVSVRNTWFVNLSEWHDRGMAYFLEHIPAFFLSLVVIYAPATLTVLVLQGYFFCARQSRSGRTNSADDNWYLELTDAGKSKTWVSFYLDSGEVIEGVPFRFPDLNTEPEARSVVVGGGPFVSTPTGNRVMIHEESIVVPLLRVKFAVASRIPSVSESERSQDGELAQRAGSAAGPRCRWVAVFALLLLLANARDSREAD